MKLENIARKDSFVHMERYVNNRKYSDYSMFSEVSNVYHPIEGNGSFMIGYADLETDYSLLLANPSTDFVPNRFFVHPEMLADYSKDPVLKRLCNLDGYLEVSPTSSTRTLLPVNNTGYFVKTHLDRRISRYIRRIRASSVEHSLKISRDIDNAIDLPSNFGYLPESVGIVYGGVGQILRESTPRPFSSNSNVLIPYFSMHSHDLKNSKDEPLMVQMIKERNLNPSSFIIDMIEPVVSSWCYFAQKRGILLESHGQNTLLELDSDLNFNRVVIRDFQSLMVDSDMRRVNGLHLDFDKHILGHEDGITSKQNYSFVYDWFLGHYLFDKIIETGEEYFDVDKKEIQGNIKEIFNHHFKDQKEFFPKEVYGFTKNWLDDNQTELKVKRVGGEYR
jgi:hypothetical protein